MGAYGAALTPPCATSCVCARSHLPQLKLGRYIPHILSYFHTSSVGPLDGKASALCADSQNPELNDVEERERITRYFAPAEDALTTWNYANLIVLLQVFFFCCRIPFAVVDHWAFRALLYALRPVYGFMGVPPVVVFAHRSLQRQACLRNSGNVFRSSRSSSEYRCLTFAARATRFPVCTS